MEEPHDAPCAGRCEGVRYVISVMFRGCVADDLRGTYGKNLAVSHIGKDWSDANVQHEKWVKIAKLMGYVVFSDEIDGKEKAPDAAATAQGAER